LPGICILDAVFQVFLFSYVMHTLEASIWCILTTHNYRDAVLRAVNLGIDSDTNGTVCGGLSGLLYGFDSIPSEWVGVLAPKDDICDLAERLGENFYSA